MGGGAPAYDEPDKLQQLSVVNGSHFQEEQVLMRLSVNMFGETVWQHTVRRLAAPAGFVGEDLLGFLSPLRLL